MRLRRFRPLWGIVGSAVLVLSALGAAACGALRAASPGEAKARPRLALHPCHVKDLPEEVRCGALRVPEDRSRSGGRTIDIQVAVLPAVRPAKAPDPLFIFAGGPGQGARSYGRFVQAAFKEVRRTRDVVLVDVRGTGASNPLECPVRARVDLAFFPNEEDIRACLASLPGDPRLYTNEFAVDDLNDVRAALGYETINLWGGSYGTRTALVYARRHPATIRSVVLDGAAPFEVTFPLHTGWSAQRALDRTFADCAAEPGCRTAFPNARGALDRLLARLDAGPIQARLRDPRTGRAVEVTVTRAAFVTSLRGLLYGTASASLVPFALHAAAEGDFAPLLAQHLETVSWSTGTMSLGMMMSVLCSEDVPRITEDEARREARLDATATIWGRSEIDEWRERCALWPRGPLPALADDRDEAFRAPTLILSGDLDPVTPPRWGEAMKDHFPGALHVTVPGTGHNTSTVGCVPELIARFIETGDPAAIDASCVNSVRRPPFVIDPSGTAP